MLPRVILYNAVSLDGRIDRFTPDIGLFYELAGHWRENATLAGSDTILKATEEIPEEEETNSSLPKIASDDTRPWLVVPDSKGRIKSWHYWKKQPYWRDVIVLCSAATPKNYLQYLEKQHIQYIRTGQEKVDLRKALEELNAQYRVQVVRVDSGGTLNGILLRAGLVDEVSLLLHPSLVGGTTPRSFFRAPDLTADTGAIPLELTHFEKVKENIVWLRYKVLK
jgi:2,5-diamino-6-(ribosylamino)-4(3H)-pyrimidinone 5'-phosphate reductase